jgi:hypothetical protein
VDSFVRYMLTKHGMSDALPHILAARDGLRGDTRSMLRDAIATLLRAGAIDGSLRDDVAAEDIMMALGGVTLIAGAESQRDLAGRLLDLLMAGLRKR